MPGRQLGAIKRRGGWRLRTVMLAVLVAAVLLVLAAGAASADAWPSGQQEGLVATHR
jgi:hypothetical protein